MATQEYQEFENSILDCFNECTSLFWNDVLYTDVEAFQPRPTRNPNGRTGGECRTDVYVSLRQNGQEMDCIKISAKMANWEFLVNKLQPHDAESLFGDGWSSIIESHTNSIEALFSQKDILYKSGSEIRFTLGWRLDVTKSSSRELLVPLTLSTEDIRNKVFRGCELPDHRRNANVNGIVIDDSGVADYLLQQQEGDEGFTDVSSLIASMDLLSTYEPPTIYLAFVASNYRIKADKVEGSRCLAVRVDWSVEDNKLTSSLKFNQPLEHKGTTDVLPVLRQAFNEVGIHPSNFDADSIRDFNIDSIYTRP